MGEYELTEQLSNRLPKIGIKLVCEKCKQPIRVGEKVVSRNRGEAYHEEPFHRKLYHEKCWRSLFL